MSQSNEFKAMLDLAFKRSTKTSNFAAQAFFEICENLTEGRQKHKEALRAKSAKHRELSNKFAIAAAASFAGWVLLLSIEAFLELNVPYSDTLYLVSIVGAFVLAGFTLSIDSKAIRVEEELELFKPLSENPKNCSYLRDLSMNAPLIKDYVRTVVDDDEELTVGDLNVAMALLDGIYKEEEMLKGKRACQELHGLSSEKAQ